MNGGAWHVEALQKGTRIDCAEVYVSISRSCRIGMEEKVRGWSTQERKDEPSSSLVEDTEEMISWRAKCQLEVDECWTKIVGKMEEEVLNKYKVEDSKRGAY